MLNWASRFNICCFLDNHQYQSPPHAYECLLAAGSLRQLEVKTPALAFPALEEFSRLNDDWLFGHFGFDLKNETGPFTSSHPDLIGFPDLFFFVPQFVIELSQKTIRIGIVVEEDKEAVNEGDQAWEDILREIGVTPEYLPGMAGNGDPAGEAGSGKASGVKEMGPLQARFSQEEYIRTIQRLREHILRGDCYEINFCQEFFTEQTFLDPVAVYLALSGNSPMPFGAFYKLGDKYLLCASPERYLQRKGQTLISQPIKGTWTRDLRDPGQDNQNRELLYHSDKDRSENVMVVDLVRNDLSKICIPGTVRVDELYGIYRFPQVYQMISTVSGEIPPGTSLVECIRSSFPMGSMTGAPKKRVLELIEQYERTRRGLFSGALGYISPVNRQEGFFNQDPGAARDETARDFDFNVVIRSILYNHSGRCMSFQVGSGITFNSDPENEYEECMLKAEAIRKALGIESE